MAGDHQVGGLGQKSFEFGHVEIACSHRHVRSLRPTPNVCRTALVAAPGSDDMPSATRWVAARMATDATVALHRVAPQGPRSEGSWGERDPLSVIGCVVGGDYGRVVGRLQVRVYGDGTHGSVWEYRPMRDRRPPARTPR